MVQEDKSIKDGAHHQRRQDTAQERIKMGEQIVAALLAIGAIVLCGWRLVTIQDERDGDKR